MTGGSADLLRSWNDTATRCAIVEFVETTTRDLAPEDRVAVFDNDGTLWCEKPMPIQLDFILRRFVEMAAQDAALREQQPWKAAYEKDFAWFGAAVTKHYRGDDADLEVLMNGLIAAFGGMSVEDYEADASAFLAGTQHPTLARPYSSCIYRPMVELLRYLEAHGFATFIVSGGDRDFMRPAATRLYGIPADRVIGSSFALGYREDDDDGGTVIYKSGIDFFDDGPEKPVRIWSRVGRRPILAAGNSNGDIEMLRFAGGPSRPALRLLVLHDDAEREFDYTGGAERSLEQAKAQGWTVISVKNDWTTVFAS